MDVLEAIADPTRRRIVELVAGGPMAAGAIAAHFDLTRPAVSQHLRILADARVLNAERHGTRRIYALAPESLEQAGDWLAAQAVRWRRSLDTLEAALDGGTI